MDIKITGVQQALNELAAKNTRIDTAVNVATRQIGLIASTIMKQQIVGGHPYGTPRSAGKGIVKGKPSSVTGHLKQFIRPRYHKIGFGDYSAIVGSSMEYSIYLEEGSSTWKSGVKYPFVAPTAKIMTKNKRVQLFYRAALAKALR